MNTACRLSQLSHECWRTRVEISRLESRDKSGEEERREKRETQSQRHFLKYDGKVRLHAKPPRRQSRDNVDEDEGIARRRRNDAEDERFDNLRCCQSKSQWRQASYLELPAVFSNAPTHISSLFLSSYFTSAKRCLNNAFVTLSGPVTTEASLASKLKVYNPDFLFIEQGKGKL